MQAITTKYIPATNNRPSRIKAKLESKSITVSCGKLETAMNVSSYSHDEEIHRAAAIMLMKEMANDCIKKFNPTDEIQTRQCCFPWLNNIRTGQIYNGWYVHLIII